MYRYLKSRLLKSVHKRAQRATLQSLLFLTTFDPSVALFDQSACNICLESFEAGERVLSLPCYHYYHVGCLEEWFKGKDLEGMKCPVCSKGVVQGVVGGRGQGGQEGREGDRGEGEDRQGEGGNNRGSRRVETFDGFELVAEELIKDELKRLSKNEAKRQKAKKSTNKNLKIVSEHVENTKVPVASEEQLETSSGAEMIQSQTSLDETKQEE